MSLWHPGLRDLRPDHRDNQGARDSKHPKQHQGPTGLGFHHCSYWDLSQSEFPWKDFFPWLTPTNFWEFGDSVRFLLGP